MSNKFHKDFIDDDNHALPARTYADISDRDNDIPITPSPPFQTAGDIDRLVRVNSPLSYYILASIGPAVWSETSSTGLDTLAKILTGGNVTGGTDLIVSTGDDLLVTDHMSVGGATAPATDASIDLKATDAAFLVNRLTTIQRDALTPLEGMQLHNLTTNAQQFYNGTFWQSMAAGDVVGPAGATSGSIPFFSDNTGKLLDEIVGVTTSGSDLRFADNVSLVLGNSSDLVIFHSGTASRITNNVGNLELINGTGGDIILDSTGITNGITVQLGTDTSATNFKILNNSSVDLFKMLGDGSGIVGGSSPHASAKFEIRSTTQGLLGPKGTEVQRDAITSPATGLQFYNLDDLQLEIFDGISWKKPAPEESLAATLAIGNTTGGNDIIFSIGDSILTPAGTPGAGGTFSVLTGDGTAGGGPISFTAGNATAGDTNGTNITFTAGNAFSIGGDTDGGHVVFQGGLFAGGGQLGQISFNPSGGFVSINSPPGGANFQLEVFDNSSGTLTNGINITQAGSGDSKLGFTAGSDLYSIGIDNSIDRFIISGGSRLSDNPIISIDPADNIGAGEINPVVRLHVSQAANGEIFRLDNTLGNLTANRTTMKIVDGGFAPPQDPGTDSNGDKIIFWDDPASLKAAIGVDVGALWLQASGVGANGISFYTADADIDPIERMKVLANGTVFVSEKMGVGELPDASSLFYVRKNQASQTLIRFANESNVAGASTKVDIRVGGSGAGDPQLNFDISGVGGWSVGLDNSDEDKLKFDIGGPAIVGSNTQFTITKVGKVGVGTSAPVASALLELSSTIEGFLLPRMTETQRTAISSPADALQLFNTNTNTIDIRSNGAWFNTVANPSNVITIASQAQWDNLISGGTLTIAVNTTLMLHTSISTADEIVVNNGINFSLIGARISTAAITYTGAGTFITATNPGFLRIDGINNIDGNSTGTLFNITGSTDFVEQSNCGVFNWSSLGSITDSAQFRVLDVGYFNSGAGFTNDNVGVSFFSGLVLANNVDMNSAYINIINKNATTNVIVKGINVLFLQANESLLGLDPGIGPAASINVTNNILTGLGDLFETNGTTGTFTAVADAFSGATISTVTDSAGVARFNFTPGPILFVDQEVVISTFITNTAYNGTFLITATGSGFFEVSSIAFGSDEGGEFLSNSITITDTATTLNNGNTITFDTTLSTDYDGGAIVYNKLTNSFQVNRTFTQTRAGSWSTNGLDQTDPRVLAFGNVGSIDSKYIAFGSVNSNTTATTITDGTYAAIATGTFISNSVSQRFKLIDAAIGLWEYTGNEPFEGFLTGSLTGLKTGGTADYRFAMTTNGAIPVFASAAFVPMEVKTTKVNIALEFSVVLIKGDTVQIMESGDGTGNNMTTTDLIFGIK